MFQRCRDPSVGQQSPVLGALCPRLWGQGELLWKNEMGMEMGLEMSIPTWPKTPSPTTTALSDHWCVRFPTAGSEASLASLDNSEIWAATASKSGVQVVNNVKFDGCQL